MLGIVHWFNNRLQWRHPWGCQVAVHQQDPSSTNQVFWDHLLCQRPHASSKRDIFAFFRHIHLFSKSLPVRNRIGPCWQDEDQWSGDWAIFVRFWKVKYWRFNELLTHPLYDKVLHSVGDFIRTNSFEYNHLLEWVELCIPLAWDWFSLRFFRIEDGLEFLLVLDEELVESFEAIEQGHRINLLVAFCPLQVA